MIESLPVFVGLTCVFMGACAFMAGQALAAGWRPAWLTLPAAMALGLGDRFLTFALFHGSLDSPAAYLTDTLVLAALALIAHRLTLARRMVAQYPWLYVPAGPFGWRDRK